jgi:hypothetical protein
VIGRVKSTATQQRASEIEFKLSKQLLSASRQGRRRQSG